MQVVQRGDQQHLRNGLVSEAETYRAYFGGRDVELFKRRNLYLNTATAATTTTTNTTTTTTTTTTATASATATTITSATTTIATTVTNSTATTATKAKGSKVEILWKIETVLN